MNRYAIRLEGSELCFSACHFITYGRGQCEPIHGHNFQVKVQWEGALGPQGYILDFIQLRSLVMEVLRPLDHRILLPEQNPHLTTEWNRHEVEVTSRRFRWVFPRRHCVFLPITNTTTELLAEYIGRTVIKLVESRLKQQPAKIRVELAESPGCWAVWEAAFPG